MILSKIFGTKSDREIKKLKPIISKINNVYKSLSSKSDTDIAERTQELRKSLPLHDYQKKIQLKMVWMKS